MIRKFTCIICPKGCEIEAEIENDEIISISGEGCAKGAAYVNQELKAPQRNIATSVLLRNGYLPLASVRLTNPIPKDKIMEAMSEIKKLEVEAPVKAGDIVVHNLLGYKTDLIITKDLERK